MGFQVSVPERENDCEREKGIHYDTSFQPTWPLSHIDSYMHPKTDVSSVDSPPDCYVDRLSLLCMQQEHNSDNEALYPSNTVLRSCSDSAKLVMTKQVGNMDLVRIIWSLWLETGALPSSGSLTEVAFCCCSSIPNL